MKGAVLQETPALRNDHIKVRSCALLFTVLSDSDSSSLDKVEEPNRSKRKTKDVRKAVKDKPKFKVDRTSLAVQERKFLTDWQGRENILPNGVEVNRLIGLSPGSVAKIWCFCFLTLTPQQIISLFKKSLALFAKEVDYLEIEHLSKLNPSWRIAGRRTVANL